MFLKFEKKQHYSWYPLYSISWSEKVTAERIFKGGNKRAVVSDFQLKEPPDASILTTESPIIRARSRRKTISID